MKKNLLIFLILGIFLLPIVYSVNDFTLFSGGGTAACRKVPNAGEIAILSGVSCPTLTINCDSGAPFLMLSSSDKAHVQKINPPSPFIPYNFKVCSTMSCNIVSSCPSTPTNCFSISGESNAHLDVCSKYSIKYCCKSAGTPVTPPGCTWDTDCPSPSTQKCSGGTCVNKVCEDYTISIDCTNAQCLWDDTTTPKCNVNPGAPSDPGTSCDPTLEDPCNSQNLVCDPEDLICVFKSCESQNGVVCQSDESCNPSPNLKLDAGDAAVCCPKPLEDSSDFPCSKNIVTLTGETQTIQYSECTNINDKGEGTRTKRIMDAQGQNKGEEQVPCAVLAKKKAVPLFTSFNLVLSIFLLIGYYLKRKL